MNFFYRFSGGQVPWGKSTRQRLWSKFSFNSCLSSLPLDFQWQFTIWIEHHTLQVMCSQGENFVNRKLHIFNNLTPNMLKRHTIKLQTTMDLYWFQPFMGFSIFRNYDPFEGLTFERLTIPNIRFTAWSFSLRLFAFRLILHARFDCF